MIRCRPILLAVAALMAIASTTEAHSTEGKRPLNVVVFLIDDLGWTDLGYAGSDLYQTPNLDKLSRQGMRFTNGYSACTVCSPTRAALMTGKYPARLHLTDWIPGHKKENAKLDIPDWTQYLAGSEVTLATVLRRAGYRTATIGKWHLGSRPESQPEAHGFDRNVAGTPAGQPPSYFSPYKIPTIKDGPKGEYLTDRLAEEAVHFLDENKDRPFFLYLPHFAVHTPLQAKKDQVAEYERKIRPGMRHTNATYAAMVASMDAAVGRVLNRLAELGLEENTILIFTSDNGGLMLRNVTVNVPLRAGKGSTYEGGVRVPLIVRWPGVTSPGSVCREPVITCDYYPTLLEATGLADDAGHKVDGASLVPLLRDANATLARDAIYWHYPHYHPGGATPYGAVRARDWKLVEFFEDNHIELYNLKDDEGEQRDLAATEAERARALREQLHAWRRALGAQMPTPRQKS
jgi:arylsulfatase A-like enzyme